MLYEHTHFKIVYDGKSATVLTSYLRAKRDFKSKSNQNLSI